MDQDRLHQTINEAAGRIIAKLEELNREIKALAFLVATLSEEAEQRNNHQTPPPPPQP